MTFSTRNETFLFKSAGADDEARDNNRSETSTRKNRECYAAEVYARGQGEGSEGGNEAGVLDAAAC